MQNPYMIAVDWGTTHFRAYCVDSNGNILDQQQDEFGASRLEQTEFEDHLTQQTLKWQNGSLPTVIAGMAGSTIGWQDVGYVECPTTLKILAQSCYRLDLATPTWIVPGLKCCAPDQQVDVMRGEETQLLGWINNHKPTEQALIILPGTHSKWVLVANENIDTFATSMTGELYKLLSEHSILKFSEEQIDDETSFTYGLEQSKTAQLLHQLFSVRAQTVLEKLSKNHQAAYLSGLLIGTEVNQMLTLFKHISNAPTTLIGNSQLIQHYQSALNFYDIQSESSPGDQAVISGLLTIYKQLQSTL